MGQARMPPSPECRRHRASLLRSLREVLRSRDAALPRPAQRGLVKVCLGPPRCDGAPEDCSMCATLGPEARPRDAVKVMDY